MLQIIIDFGTVTIFGREFPLRVFGYGLMMVLGFVTGIYLAHWRAKKHGASVQVVSTLGILGLIGGVVGARLAFVIENWNSFANHPNMIGEMLNVTSGGLIYYGGVALAAILAIIYLKAKKLSIRRYLDIIAPSIMLGLAFGRLGCLVNGCCFGGPAHEHSPLHMRFPMFSQPLVKVDGSPGPFSQATQTPTPVFSHQLYTGRIKPSDIDPRLMGPDNMPIPPRYLHGKLDASDDQLRTLSLTPDEMHRLFSQLVGPGGIMTEHDWQRALNASSAGPVVSGQAWPRALHFARARRTGLTFEEFYNYHLHRRSDIFARFDADHNGDLDEQERQLANDWLREDLWNIAANTKALPVKPAQPLAIANALLICAILLGYGRFKPSAGQIFALMMVLKSITRFGLEIVRDDNPHNLANLLFTHNQISSMLILSAGVTLWVVARKMKAPPPEPTPPDTGDRKNSDKRRKIFTKGR